MVNLIMVDQSCKVFMFWKTFGDCNLGIVIMDPDFKNLFYCVYHSLILNKNFKGFKKCLASFKYKITN